jgi:hypothetical protein
VSGLTGMFLEETRTCQAGRGKVVVRRAASRVRPARRRNAEQSGAGGGGGAALRRRERRKRCAALAEVDCVFQGITPVSERG